MSKNIRFILRVMFIHITTYIICGMIFSTVFNYAELYSQGNTQYFMHPVGNVSSLLGPAFQVVRGLLFGLILLLLRENVIEKKHGWLKLWAIIAVIGIINTPGPSPGSVEGIIYTQLPLELQIKGLPEVLVQTLLFSFFVANPGKLKAAGFVNKNKVPLISAALAGIMFSLSGIILAVILKADVMAGTTDIGAFAVMFAAILAVFFICKWYGKTASPLKHITFLACCYIMLAVAPVVYNFWAGSAFASWLTLAINLVPVIVLFLINYNARARGDTT